MSLADGWSRWRLAGRVGGGRERDLSACWHEGKPCRVPEDEFYGEFKKFLTKLKPDLDFTGLDPDTHLWAAGYLDSLGMLEVVVYLEGMLSREVALSGDFLPTFFSMRRIYHAHVAPPSGAPGSVAAFLAGPEDSAQE